MFRPIVRASLGLVAVASLGAGCGSDATSPSNADRAAADDVAVQAAASAAATTGGFAFEMETASDAFRSSGSALSDLRAKQTPGVTGKWALEELAASDTTITFGGLTCTLSRTFYDAQDVPLPSYGINAVRLVIDSRVTGSIVTLRYAATVGRHGTLEVRGVEALADTLRFDGAAQDTTQCAFRSLSGDRQRYFYVEGTRLVEAVHLLRDRSANPYPLDGRLVWTFAIDRLRSNDRNDIGWHFDGTAVLTFNGTANPELVVNGTFHYHVDLLTGEITAP